MEGFPKCGWEGDPGAMGAISGKSSGVLHGVAGARSPPRLRYTKMRVAAPLPRRCRRTQPVRTSPAVLHISCLPSALHICAAMVTESLKGFKSPSEQWRISGVILLRDEQ